MRTSNRLAAIAAVLRSMIPAAQRLQGDLPHGRSRDVAEMTALDLSSIAVRLDLEVDVLRRSGD